MCSENEHMQQKQFDCGVLFACGSFYPWGYPSTIQLVKRIPKFQRDPPTEASERHQSEAVETGQELPSGSIQSNALQHWQTHMKQRRRQQSFLSGELIRELETCSGKKKLYC